NNTDNSSSSSFTRSPSYQGFPLNSLPSIADFTPFVKGYFPCVFMTKPHSLKRRQTVFISSKKRQLPDVSGQKNPRSDCPGERRGRCRAAAAPECVALLQEEENEKNGTSRLVTPQTPPGPSPGRC